MEALTDTYLASCRRYQGRIMRGENMTRIETFVDAAFAFAFTMLVISIDEIPQSPPELFALSRDIPAFLLSATLIGSVWLAHATWSRTFGLQDGVTIYLSLGLVMLVLIFVYPIKLMVQATVIYLSGGVLGTELFDNPGWEDNSVADLFLFFSTGLGFLAILILAHYFNALRFRKPLRLNITEIHFCYNKIVGWLMVVLVAILSCVVAATANGENIAWAGYVYFSLWILIPLAERVYAKFWAHKLSLD
ncbi:MAG: TMEM175 family protein [Pseudomonadales bacterium]|nr:TMEM175 family protein [Pseudomonadales bacterium]